VSASKAQMSAYDFAFAALEGKPVWNFFPAFFHANPGITEFRLQTYRPAPKLSERLKKLLPSDEIFLQRVDDIRKSTGVPFWDVLLALAMRDGELDSQIALSALLHDPRQKADTFPLSPPEFIASKISTILSSISGEHGLVACSQVKMTNGEVGHIPMMDFRCPPCDSNAAAIGMLLRATGQMQGVLVESGKSYHLYGTSVLTPNAWIKFMSMCLLFAPVSDARYIAHRLADGECRLKIASLDRSVPLITHVITR
jgi:hypothetical protein